VTETVFGIYQHPPQMLKAGTGTDLNNNQQGSVNKQG